ncbi:mitogen-activated protein kinase 12 isoform X1 [Physcomitrium patens]|uniref:Uncharacterized protein n=1 Tax=Physcomitrium patens TaxID=3218 RepID=A0A2K1IYD3_PHYPA|nr:mitogen-activated protein kinase 12-like isoform X1 [Physcomitrium patens]XP_024403726.1 mitogen-activated protein kinase 12-like isoform X1 [Physcomitrium patens]XP_024403727.1 mitogen-activated protein kinase 12-like isoform X1 [Physcomitrium patens]PNR34289.1 hypothetical protein PHYPA_024106 [Physcomitrium patens]|eukprot:XP_024403725.1 mitogen-activated protein kinase 12-like isoform X1 [Physcomitrella patens]
MDQSSSDEEAEPNVVVVPTHGGQYVKFTKEGFDFEVSSRYTPPIQLLGCGACGPVCSMIDSITGEKVAVKKFVNGVNDPDYAKRTIREIKLLRLMNHENVLIRKMKLNILNVICAVTWEDNAIF